MGILKDLIKGATPSGIITDVIGKAADIADRFIQTKEEKDAFVKEMIELNNQDIANARNNETARDTSENSSFLSKNVHEIIALLLVCAFIGMSVWLAESPSLIMIKDAVFLVLAYLYGKSQPDKK